MQIPANKVKYTVDDYWLFPEDQVRRELIDGDLYETKSPFRKHDVAANNLHRHLRRFLEANPLGEVFLAPYSVVLSRTDVVEPDLLFVAKERASILSERGAQGAPDLVVEILAESTRKVDPTIKRELYERSGVREYWLVDPDERIVRIWRATAQGYGAPLDRMALAEDDLESPLLPGFSLSVPQIFA